MYYVKRTGPQGACVYVYVYYVYVYVYVLMQLTHLWNAEPMIFLCSHDGFDFLCLYPAEKVENGQFISY